MIFSVYVRMNNIITRKIERLRALITLAVCTRPNFRRSVAFLRCENLAGDEAILSHHHTNKLSHPLTAMLPDQVGKSVDSHPLYCQHYHYTVTGFV